ncbi:MAG TPA: HDOD domain-containing protein [Rhodocyclaceae bacterium]|nr:HDOD domain-containing protein [Rhodocyclaceae bacterium]
MSALIRHEPVLNRHQTITASRLIVHAESAALAAQALDDVIDVWPGVRSVFIGLAGCLPDHRLLEWNAPENILIEIPAPGLAASATRQLASELAAGGVPLCLDGYAPGMELPAGLQFRFLLADAAAQPLMFAAPGIPIATGLPDLPAFLDATSGGYDGAAGWFFLHGRKPADKLNPSHAQIVRVLNLVRRNAEVKDIEIALKQDVTLSYKLLRYINSAGFGLSCEIESFRHAVAILGFDKLNKWLSLLLVTASKDPAAPALMRTSVARGRLMEILGKDYFDRSALDNLFITGAFSLLGVLLGTRTETILQEMHLPEPVVDALLNGQGAYVALLDLALACEEGSSAELAQKAALLGISIPKLNHAQIEALAFADSLQFD